MEYLSHTADWYYRHRKALKQLLVAVCLAVTVTVGIPGALGWGLFSWLQGQDGRIWLAHTLENAISTPDLTLSIERIEGWVPFELFVPRVTLSDRQGVWLEADELSLSVAAGKLLSRRVEIERLEVGRVFLLRRPEGLEQGGEDALFAVGAATPADSEVVGKIILDDLTVAANDFLRTAGKARQSLRETWYSISTAANLPISAVDLRRLRIGEIKLGQSWFDTQRTVVLTAEASGEVHLDGTAIALNLRLERFDEPASASIDFRLDVPGSRLAINLELSEARGGLAARTLELPGLPSIELVAEADFTSESGRGILDLQTDDLPLLTARVSANRLDADYQLTLDSVLQLGLWHSSLPSPWDKLIDPSVSLLTRWQIGSQSVALQRGFIRSASHELLVSGSYAWNSRLFELRFSMPQLSRNLLEATDLAVVWDKAELYGTLKGDRRRLSFSAEVRARKVVGFGLGVGELAVALGVSDHPISEQLVEPTQLNLVATLSDLSWHGDVDPANGSAGTDIPGPGASALPDLTVSSSLHFDREHSSVQLGKVNVTFGESRLTQGSGSIGVDPSSGVFSFDFAGRTPDLAAWPALGDHVLSGSGQLAFNGEVAAGGNISLTSTGCVENVQWRQPLLEQLLGKQPRMANIFALVSGVPSAQTVLTTDNLVLTGNTSASGSDYSMDAVLSWSQREGSPLDAYRSTALAQGLSCPLARPSAPPELLKQAKDSGLERVQLDILLAPSVPRAEVRAALFAGQGRATQLAIPQGKIADIEVGVARRTDRARTIAGTLSADVALAGLSDWEQSLDLQGKVQLSGAFSWSELRQELSASINASELVVTVDENSWSVAQLASELALSTGNPADLLTPSTLFGALRRGWLKVYGARSGDIALSELAGELAARPHGVDISLMVQTEPWQAWPGWDIKPLRLEAQSRWNQDSSALYLETITGRVIGGSTSSALELVQPATVHLARDSVELSGLQLRLAGGIVELESTYQFAAGGTRNFQADQDHQNSIDATLALRSLPVVLPLVEFSELSALLTGEVRLSGSLGNPRLELSLRGLRTILFIPYMGDVPELETSFDLHWANSRLTVNLQLVASDGSRSDVGLRFSTPARLSLLPLIVEPSLSSPIEASVNGIYDLTPFSDLLEIAKRRISGQVSLSVTITGSIIEPVFGGTIRLGNASYQDWIFGTQLENGLLVLRGIRGGFALERLSFNAPNGGGIVATRGRIDLSGLSSRVDIPVTVINAQLVDNDDLSTRLEGRLTLGGSILYPEISGRVSVLESELHIPDEPPPEIVEMEVEEIGTPPIEPLPPPEVSSRGLMIFHHQNTGQRSMGLAGMELEIEVQAPGSIRLHSCHFHMQLGGRLRIEGVLSKPLVFGRLQGIQGRVNLFDRTFELERANFEFTGRDDLLPSLDVEAVSSDFGSAGDATLDVEGVANAPRIRLQSTGDTSAILTQDWVGQSGDAWVRAAAALAAQLGCLGERGSVGELVRSQLQLDRLGLEGDAGEQRLSAGRFLVEDSIYLGVDQVLSEDITDDRSNTRARLQIRLIPNLQLGALVGLDGIPRLGFTLEWEY